MEFLKKPKFLLGFFTLCNLWVYLDRGVMGGVLTEVEDEYNLSKTEDGIIGSAFVISYMIFCPLFAQLSHKYRPTRLVTIGLLIFCVAAVCAAISIDFYTLVGSRLLIGAGEASFAGLAPTFIDDIAPPKKRSIWFGVFYSALPVGAALGYGVAGFLSSVGWRYNFFLEAILMFPLAILCFFIPRSSDVVLLHDEKSAEEGSQKYKKVEDTEEGTVISQPTEVPITVGLKQLATNARYDLIVFGTAAWVGVIGALSFWLPDFLVDYLDVSLATANTGVGAVTVISGLLGNFFGGYLLDRLGGGIGEEGVARSLKISLLFTLAALPFAYGALMFKNAVGLFVTLGVAELLLFINQTPISVVVITIVPTELRSLAMGMNIFCIHLFGDLPSPTLVGVLSDVLNSERTSLMILVCWFWITVITWFIAWRMTVRMMKEQQAREERKPLLQKPHSDALASDPEGPFQDTSMKSYGSYQAIMHES
mmetsp:Transcript_11756/g.16314  ORF Transcript_11756/g.16314 Transcript_11756/m.16314 type:complete len:479 (-) Transcript_11756:39-1475(-)